MVCLFTRLDSGKTWKSCYECFSWGREADAWVPAATLSVLKWERPPSCGGSRQFRPGGLQCFVSSFFVTGSSKNLIKFLFCRVFPRRLSQTVTKQWRLVEIVCVVHILNLLIKKYFKVHLFIFSAENICREELICISWLYDLRKEKNLNSFARMVMTFFSESWRWWCYDCWCSKHNFCVDRSKCQCRREEARGENCKCRIIFCCFSKQQIKQLYNNAFSLTTRNSYRKPRVYSRFLGLE